MKNSNHELLGIATGIAPGLQCRPFVLTLESPGGAPWDYSLFVFQSFNFVNLENIFWMLRRRSS